MLKPDRMGAFRMTERIAWQTWLMMLWPYSLIPTGFLMAQLTIEAALCCLGVWVLLTLVVCGLTVWYAVTKQENAPRQGRPIKLVHIPFYGLVFLFGMMTVAAPPMTIGLFLLDGLLMLTSSSYGIAAALRAWRQGELHPLVALLLIAGHCIFVVDVISSRILLWFIEGE